jgi:hypothetical protein
MESCSCQECRDYRDALVLRGYLDDRRRQLNEKMQRLRGKKNVPQSGLWYVDRQQIYTYLARELLTELCATLGLPPMAVTLEPTRLDAAPNVRVAVSGAWEDHVLRGKVVDTEERRRLVQAHIDSAIASACRGFMRRLEKAYMGFGYIERREQQQPEDAAAN